MQPLRIGVVGVGHMGRIHTKLLSELPALQARYTLQGVYDADAARAKAVADEFGTQVFPSLEALVDAVDVVDCAAATAAHYDVLGTAIRQARHCFVEKPAAATAEEARELADLAREANVKVMVGHVERYNPALLAVRHHQPKPLFIEAHRLAPWNPRGADVSVVQDLMIHDLDIVLHLVQAPVSRLSASGVAVLSQTADIANARLEFANGCVANLTASRLALKTMRKIRLFQPGGYLSLDFLESKAELVHLYDQDPGLDGQPNGEPVMAFEHEGRKRWLRRETPPVPTVNAIEEELKALADAIAEDLRPPVDLDHATQALDVAERILERMESSLAG